MKIKIEISDRLHDQLIKFCKINDLSLNVYLLDKIERGFSIDRFGDLNVLSGFKTTEQVENENRDIEILKNKDNVKDAYYDATKKGIIIIDDNDEQYFVDISRIEHFKEYFTDKVNTTKVIEEVREKTKISRRQIKSK